MSRALVLLLIVSACEEGVYPSLDAAIERPSSDGTILQDSPPVAVTVDFSIEGCTTLDPITFICSGNVPLTLQFVPIATPSLTKFQWDFGDGSPFEPDPAPSHEYTLPGIYTVNVVAAGVGASIVSKEKKDIIRILPNKVGDACTTTGQCKEGLTCLCSGLNACMPGLAMGLCTSSCESQACSMGETCADLVPASFVENREPWQERLCLKVCTSDSDCGPFLHCRSLPGFPVGSPWIRGCFAKFPAELGVRCVDPTGTRRHDLCSGGLCTGLGANGLCSFDCSMTACPTGTECAQFGDGRKLCLRPCSSMFTCAADPLLTCVAPGKGLLGFTLEKTAPRDSAYCAPKPCVSDDTCGIVGRCALDPGGGHCVLR